jgi:hypothetical protein
VNPAVTELYAFRVSEQTPVPLHTPLLQPVKNEYWEAVGESVTGVPKGNGEEQFELQAIPDGVLVTVPLPLPENETLRSGGIGAKLYESPPRV